MWACWSAVFSSASGPTPGLVIPTTVLSVPSSAWLSGTETGRRTGGCWPPPSRPWRRLLGTCGAAASSPRRCTAVVTTGIGPRRSWPGSGPSPAEGSRCSLSWAPWGTSVPAVMGPGAAEEAADDHDHAGQREPERHTGLLPLSAPAQLAERVQPGMGPLDDPTPASLDWGGHTLDD